LEKLLAGFIYQILIKKDQNRKKPRLRTVLVADGDGGRNQLQNPGEQPLLLFQLQRVSAPSYKDDLLRRGALSHKGRLSLSSSVEGNVAAQKPESS
jgi:hypothetical protein